MTRQFQKTVSAVLACLLICAVSKFSEVNAKPPTKAKELTERELDRERREKIVPVPKSNADYTFGIDKMRPAWEGMTGTKIVKDYFGPGVDALEVLGRKEVGRAVYCDLENIKPGKYYVGLWVESGNIRSRSEYSPGKLLLSAYLNGWPLRFSNTSDPVQVAKGRWLIELQTAKPVSLKNADELAFCPAGNEQKVLRIALYQKKPVQGHGFTGRTFGIDRGTPQRLRLVINAKLKGDGKDGGQHEAKVKIANPLPYPVDTEVTWKLADYFGAPIEEKTETIHIEPHKVWSMSKPFVAKGDDQAYQLDVKTRPAKNSKSPCPRPEEWMELNDWTKMQFLPKQPGPLEVWNHVRMNLYNNKTGKEKYICIDGDDWECAPLAGRVVPKSVPADLKFKKSKLPALIRLPKDKFGMWFRKKLTIPEWMLGQNFLIELYGGTELTLFVNGKRVGCELCRLQGHSALGWAQFSSADFTKALKHNGENELVICARGGIALMDPSFVEKYDASSREKQKDAKDNQAKQGWRYTQVGLERILLRSVPPVRIRQTLVMSDVEKKILKIFARVSNDDDKARKVILKFQVFQNGKNVNLNIPDKIIEVPANSLEQIVFEVPAGNLIPYTPKNPVLAKLATTLIENGKATHTLDKRFGYRSIRVKGTGLSMNGKPVKLLGTSFRGSKEVFEGEDGVDIMRTVTEIMTAGFRSWADQWDLYDEIGYLHYPGTNVVANEGSWKKINNEAYWNDAKNALVEMLWTIGWHPCVVAWEMSNESYHYVPYITGIEAQDKLGARIYSVIEHMRKEIWPGLWCIADGDEDLGGRLDFCSFHYLNHGGTYDFGKKRMNNTEATEKVDGYSHYPPDCFYLNGTAEIPRKGTVLHMNPDWEYGSVACGDTESFWMTGHANGVSTAKYLGDKAVLSTSCQFFDPRGAFFNKLTLDAYRDMEAITSGMYFTSALGIMAPDVTFSMPQQAIRYYSGKRFDRRINIHDDEFAPGDLEFRWKLIDSSGKVINEAQFKERSNTAFLSRKKIAFNLPKVSKRTKYTLLMELWKDGEKRAAEERRLEVWPTLSEKSTPKTVKGIVVFDPSGKVIPILKKLGFITKKIEEIDKQSLSDAKVLVIGPGTAKKNMASERDEIEKFARSGGRVLFLRQEFSSLLPGDIGIESRLWASQGFICSKNHPVMKGLEDVDFQMWNPDHLIVKGAFRKPDKGNTLTLLESFHVHRSSHNMQWSDILEIFLGKGSIMAVQLPLVKSFDIEPMAAETLRRAMTYMGQTPFRLIDKQLAILGKVSGKVLDSLKKVRVDYKSIDKVSNTDPVTLLDMNITNELPKASELRSYVENGGTLILHRSTPKNTAWLKSLIGKDLKLEVQPYQAWADKQILKRSDGIMEGLNNLDFYWRSQIGGETSDSRYQVSNGVKRGQERGQTSFIVKVPNTPDKLFPGGLVEVPIGKGRVIIDQLKWEVSDEKMISGSPSRIISNILTNLGVKQRLPEPKPVLPPNVICETIDLAALVNRSLKDEKSGDGVGWKDWGPEQDLRDFPTGDINLKGTPFHVTPGEKNCIFLRSRKRWVPSLADYPVSVTIPVNKKNVGGLWFLHTGGWMYGAKPFAWREINYSDGSTETIPLNETNTGDWNYGHDDFPIEEVTTSSVAWKGKCQMYPVTRVYKTLWVNPHPEKEIKEVVLTTRDLPEKECRVLTHLAVTAAILQKDGDVKRDVVKSQKLMQEALKLIRDKKQNDGIAKLKLAVKADNQNAGAWKELTIALKPVSSENEFITLCRKWIQAMPKCYEAHNILGQFLEEKGRLEEALAEYNKSLEIEWNQPITIVAKNRLEKAIKK